MGLSIGRLIAALHEIIPAHKAADWDVTGLALGDPTVEVSRVAVCHEVTEAVVDTVEANAVDLLVTYHPLLFRPTNRLLAGSSPAGRTLRLARAGVALAVAHTSFDAAADGTADALARALGLGDIVGFGPVVPPGQVSIVAFVPPSRVEEVAGAMEAAGGGTIGNYSGCSFRAAGTGAFTAGAGTDPAEGAAGHANREPEVRIEMIAPAGRADDVVAALAAAHPYEEPAFNVTDVRANVGFIGRVGTLDTTFDSLVRSVSELLGSTGLRAAKAADAIGRVAVVPGSGSSFVSAARSAGADVLVTGDVAHHIVREALDRGMSVIDPGHAATERPGMKTLAGVVSGVATAHGIDVVDLTSVDPTPWQ